MKPLKQKIQKKIYLKNVSIKKRTYNMGNLRGGGGGAVVETDVSWIVRPADRRRLSTVLR